MPKSTPNYLTIAADGSTGAVFAGGVQMPEANDSVLPPPNTKSLRWVRASNGAMVANIYATTHDGSGPQNLVVKSAAAPDPGSISRSGNVELWAESGVGSPAVITARAGVIPGAQVATILDSNGNSDFLRYALTGGGLANKKMMNTGFVDLTWVTSNASPIVTVPHGITNGTVPIVTATMGGRGSGALLFAQFDAVDVTNFQVGGICTNSGTLSGTFRCYWTAVG